ncbi:hypothetical protein [Thermosulfidibacter takaii]|uniref:hypothetical protein n=1 Tax=Thermosulfidibacter takaii TaxID=412593 RepID=UPI00130E7D65|nr:hypothetical protein [Thermosulfidibacter takaii]
MISQDQKESGKWEAIECNKVIRKVYIYSSMGFPIATVKVEGNRLKIEGKAQKNLPAELETTTVLLAKMLPNVARKEHVLINNRHLYLKKTGDLMVIKQENFTVKIKIEGMENYPPPQNHQKNDFIDI